jgi:hypothetical protein
MASLSLCARWPFLFTVPGLGGKLISGMLVLAAAATFCSCAMVDIEVAEAMGLSLGGCDVVLLVT